MPDSNDNLYLYEALELRKAYDRRIALLERFFKDQSENSWTGFRHNREGEHKIPVSGFDKTAMEKNLKSLQIRRVKLNQEIQKANFDHTVEYKGESVNLAEALEIRKNLLAELELLSGRVERAAYKRIIYKEKRDIEQAPRYDFEKSYNLYNDTLDRFRLLVTAIHAANHESTVAFKADM